MSHRIVLIAFFMVFISFRIHSQSFEGKIHFIYETHFDSFKGAFWVKSPQTAFEIIQVKDGVSYSSATFYKPATHTIEIKSHTSAGKNKYVYGAEAIKSRFNLEGDGVMMMSLPDTREIAGRNCQKYQILLNDYVILTFIDPELSVDTRYFSLYLKDDPVIQMMAKKEMKGFPLMSVINDKNGNLVWKTTVTGIEESVIPAADFEIGSEFVEMK
ncbi:MAG: hypothetical protein K1X92_17285 [Bacteroidia bacterium]|nr:hypothetical protein [Bacteroidia bacterium]